MKKSYLSNVKSKVAQRGVAAVEFALVAIPFFLLMFGTMEFGRLLYLWNTVQEVTRNAARQAVVTDFTNAAAMTAIKRSAVFRNTDGTLPASSEISNASVNIKYLNAAGTVPAVMPLDPGDNIAACLDATRTDTCIKFVEVSVCSGDPCVAVSFIPMISLFSQSGPYSTDLTGLKIPLSTVRMPAESLGFSPDS
ncbi:MAG: pilus assembly protein [Polaromonas sp.]|nr:pilus assembly protein [Polaromonas sp.]